MQIEDIYHNLEISREKLSQVSGFQIDSRKILPQELFFALPGARVDGHFFLREVKERGGVAAIVWQGYRGPDFGLELIRVEDVGRALRLLAQKKLEKGHSRVVGITGSLGKTTTKELTATLLQARYRVEKPSGNQNTKLTLPLALLNGSSEAEVWVLEMGASEPGDIARLIEVAPPEIAVWTKLSLAHAASFAEGLEGIAKEKKTIFSHPLTKTAIFDQALKPFLRDMEGKDKISFSMDDADADYFLRFTQGRLLIDERGVRVASFEWARDRAHPQFLHNFAASLAVARCLHVEWRDIEAVLPQLMLPKMRFELFRAKGIMFVNDAYNANPDSMRAALSHLPEPDIGGKKVAVLASMKELGPYSEKAHEEIGHFAGKYVDYLLTFGNEAEGMHRAFAETKKPTEHFQDLESLAQKLSHLMHPGDVVLCKGSRSLQLEQLFLFLAIEAPQCS